MMTWFVLLYLFATSVTHSAAWAPGEVLTDNAAPDYTTLLSVRSSGIVHKATNSDGLSTKHVGAITPTTEKGRKLAAPGIVFVKMIKVAGELFSSMLSQYAFKQGWRVLQNKKCREGNNNPLGQATCECDEH